VSFNLIDRILGPLAVALIARPRGSLASGLEPRCVESEGAR